MVDYLKIAWRNLRRNKVRTFISILAITVVVMIVVFSRGLIQGFTGSFSEEVINNTSGHVRVVNEEYRAREVLRSLDYPVDGFQGQGLEHMIDKLETLDLAEHILPRLQFGALFSTAGDMQTILGVGIDPQREEQHGTLVEDIVAGRMPESGDEIVVGRGLLEKMDREVGGRVTLMYSDAFHSFRGRTFTIVGVRDSGFTMIDDNMFYLSLDRAQHILAMEDQATEVLIFGSTRAHAKELKNGLTALFDEYDKEEKYAVIHWLEADKFLALMEEFDIIYDFIYLGFVLLGAIILTSTMNLIIRERKTEIGMMLALGLRGRDIMKIFTFEGAFMGLIGSFLGTLGGGALNYYLSQNGIHIQALAELVREMEFMFEPVFYPVYNLENLIFSFLMGIIVVTLACLYPARKAGNMEPVDALQVDE